VVVEQGAAMSIVEAGSGPPARSSRLVWLQRAAVATIWVGAIVAWQLHQSSTGRSVTETAQAFIDVVGESWWGVVAYVLVYLARPIVLFPASLLTIVAGILFGPVVGVVVVVFAANASAMVAYGVGRLLGRPPAGSDAEPGDLSMARRWSNRMRDNSFETVLIMRLLFLPYDLVNYLAGLLRLRWLPFLLATALGSLPGTVSFVLLGASLDRVDDGLGGIDPVALGASVVIFVVSIVLARILRRRQPDDMVTETIDEESSATPATVTMYDEGTTT
jgi:uncharacterized membrane protein YdjX (TVP38/TMEM64 family)